MRQCFTFYFHKFLQKSSLLSMLSLQCCHAFSVFTSHIPPPPVDDALSFYSAILILAIQALFFKHFSRLAKLVYKRGEMPFAANNGAQQRRPSIIGVFTPPLTEKPNTNDEFENNNNSVNCDYDSRRAENRAPIARYFLVFDFI